MSTENQSEKAGMAGFKPFIIIFAILVVVSFLLKIVMNMIM
jgi:hypothetical protein